MLNSWKGGGVDVDGLIQRQMQDDEVEATAFTVQIDLREVWYHWAP